MIVGSEHNQPKARPKDQKKQLDGTKFAYLTVKEKQKKLITTRPKDKKNITDHNQKPMHNKHTTH